MTFRCKLFVWWLIPMLLTAAPGLYGGNMRFSHLSNINQLPSNTIHTICQDHKGFIWIGTENGLCRWDGYTMVTYEPSLENPDNLPSKSILKVFADSQDRLWVITSRGLRYYDYRKNSFSAPKNDIATLSLCAIAESQQGLYLGISDILHSYNEREDRFEPILVHGREVRNRFTSLAVDAAGDVWAGTKTDGLIHINRGHTVITHFRANDDTRDWLASNQINTLYYSPSGVLWIGTNNRGACYYHIDKQRFYVLPELSDASITAFCEDADQNLWIGTNQGLYIYNPHLGSIVAHQVKDPSNYNLLSDNLITVIFRDREHNMLVGTRYGGINIQPYMFRQFSFYDWGEGESYLSGRTVRQILPDGNGDIWIATEDGNLNRLVQSNNTIQKLLIPGKENSNPYALLKDRKGRLWIGTTSNGLYCYTPQTGRFDQFTVEHYPGLSTNHILALLEDSEGRLWVGTTSGLVIYDEAKDLFIQFEPYRFRKQSINHLMMDDAGNVWIATHAQGLFYYNKEQKRIREFTLRNTDGQTIRSNKHINYIYQDSRHHLWISTNYDGLICYAPEQSRYTTYTTQNHLLSNTVYSIIEDGNGNIWASTDNGLSCYDQSSDTFVNYSVSDGLPNKQFSNNSVYCDPDGYLYFGTINGMITFHPDSLRLSLSRAQVELTELRVLGKNVVVYPSEKCDLADGSRIRLSSAQAQSFSISYTVPTISHASSLFFASSFGTDTQWDYVGMQKQINFANLAPGEYRLQLKASFNNRWDGNEPVTTIHIEVEPPFWRSTVMCCCYLVIFLCLLFLGWRTFRIRQRRHAEQLASDLERKKDSELHRMQLNFFTNISHQLRIPLSLIIGPLESMIDRGSFSGETERRMRLLARNAVKMKYLIDELLHFTQIKNLQKKIHLREGDIQSFIHDITDGFLLLAEERHIDFQVHVPQSGPSVWFSPQDVEKIVFNLLSNAFKYTPEGRISITSSLDTSSGPAILHLSVEDTGIGIEADKLNHIFEAYYQVNEWERSGQTGFGIGLALTRELVELHKGSIQVTSSPGKGSCFSLTLGVDKSFFSEDQLSRKRIDKVDIREYKFLSVEPERKFEVPDTKENRHVNPSRKHTILVVEDEPELLHFYQELFSGEFRVLLAHNGLEGWDVALKQLPDVIISDVMMPEMNGYELVQRLKSHIATSHIQVILLTAKSGDETQIESYQAGADFYLEKPFHPAALYEQVKNLLQSREKLIHRYIAGQVEAAEIVSNNLDAKFLARIDSIIKKNLANEQFSINDLTSTAGISRTQLHLKLKSIVGMSTTEYINHLRLKESLVLLQAGYRVSEAAYSTGFSSPNYFTRLFRKKFGMLPGVYAEEHRQHGNSGDNRGDQSPNETDPSKKV